MRFFLFVISIFLYIPVSGKSSAGMLHLKGNDFLSVGLTPYAGLYTDNSGKQTIAEILAIDPDFQSDFASEQPTPYPVAHWLKIEVTSSVDIPNRWLVFKGGHDRYPFLSFIEYVDAYFVRNGVVQAYHRSGYLVPKREKSVQERAAVVAIPFSIPRGDTMTVYIRLRSAFRSGKYYLEPELIHPLPNISYTTDWIKWTMYGGNAMYLIIGFFVLVFWFFVRHPSYLYFGAFCLLFSVHYFHLEPATSMVDRLFPNRPHLVLPVFYFFAIGSLNFFLLFGRSFSELKERLPKWDIYFQIVIGLNAFLFLYFFINSFFEPYNDQAPFALSVIFLLIFPLSLKFVLGKHRLARIFGLGLFWFFFWSIIGILDNYGILSLPFIPWPVGQIGLLMIYALGLGYKILDSERQKAQADRIRELDAIKSRFFANISHEFRTPLSLILGPINQSLENIPASEAVDDAEEVPVKGRHLKVVRRNAIRLLQLVDQLLDLSKLDSGKMKLTVSEGKMIGFIRSIVFSFESLAEHRHLHFHTSFPAEPDSAWFDRDKLEKILVNLLSNAFKFTPEHGTIGVRVVGDQGYLKIAVSDSGPGIPAEEIDKVFDRFYQVTEQGEGKGTGIGLSLVKELVELHGGQITVNSVQGEGTTFKVNIPFRKEYFAAEQLLHSPGPEKPSIPIPGLLPEEDPSAPAGSATDENIPLALIVEDNADLRRYIQENLERDYQVILAEDGQKGWDMAVQKIPDIIISDVMMPGKNGYELCATLKTDTRTSHIPVILLTARAGQEQKLEGLEQGADAYLTKPFDVRELKVQMTNLVEQRRRLRERFSGELKIRPTQVTLNSVDERFIKDVMKHIEENMGNEYFTVEDLARAVGFSRSQLNRKIKALTDKTSNQLIRDFRLTRAKELLEQKTASVSEVAYLVGYSNLSYFSKSYKDTFGILPSET